MYYGKTENTIKIYYKGFTLAEVLITLVIIGLVAALTIPTIIKTNNKIETESALKKAFSVISNAVNMAISENGNIETWDWDDGTVKSTTSDRILKNVLGKYLHFGKYCGTAMDENCIASRKDLNGTTYIINHPYNFTHPRYAKGILADGTSIALIANAASGWEPLPGYAQIIVDTNGLKKPNQLGKDVFLFDLNPVSNKLEGAINNWPDWLINTGCQSSDNGGTCSTRIMRNGWRIDY